MTYDWTSLREREFPVSRRHAYLDHAAVAALPARSAQMIRAWVDDQEQNGALNWLEWEKRLGGLRRNLALLINAHVDEIALINSTTQGIGLVAEGYPWKPGDNVVGIEEEYPSNIYPWRNLRDRGVELRLVPAREGRIWPEDIDAAMDDRTRILAISHVEFASGFCNDLDRLGALCRRRGVALFVDAIQGLGPLLIDVERTPIDFLAADGHKWLLGPEGAGFLYVRRNWFDRLRTLGVGWHSVTTSFNASTTELQLKPNAERWEGGSFAMAGHQGFASSIELIHEIGPGLVSERILERAETVRELALRAGWRVHGSALPGDTAGIVALEHPMRNPDAVARLGRSTGVVVSCRRGKLRVSPHVYNDDHDLDRLAGLLRDSSGSND